MEITDTVKTAATSSRLLKATPYVLVTQTTLKIRLGSRVGNQTVPIGKI